MMWMKQSYKMLIIDEAKQYKKLFTKLFVSRGVLIEFTDIDKVQEMVETLKPDLMLLDLEASGDEGIGLLRRLISTYSIPVVVLGCNGEIALKAMMAGARHCIPKPDMNSIPSVNRLVDELVEKIQKENKKPGLFSLFSNSKGISYN